MPVLTPKVIFYDIYLPLKMDFWGKMSSPIPYVLLHFDGYNYACFVQVPVYVVYFYVAVFDLEYRCYVRGISVTGGALRCPGTGG